MPELLETLETIRAEDASVHRLFDGGNGEERTYTRRGRSNPQYLSRLAEAAAFVAAVLEGQRPAYHLREAMTTSDFPLLFGDILDRQVLTSYRQRPTTYRSYLRVARVNDFRPVQRMAVDGGIGELPLVPEQSEYPETSLREARAQWSVSKHGRRMPFSWEAIINDDLDQLRDIPQRFGASASISEEAFATRLFVDADGPHDSVYTAGRGNIITGNPALSVDGLTTALNQMATMTDDDGNPIITEVAHLVVPPALAVPAAQIMNATEFTIETSAGRTMKTANHLRNALQVHVNRYIPIVATTNGGTSWFLFADPNAGRPFAEIGFLRGHEEPEVWIKRANAIRAGGGDVSPLEGDFDTDSIQYRVRHVFGGGYLNEVGGWRSTLASNGTGV